ncbi:hypothetical protein LPB140_01345 [Sphingorhabdus lutea]|uniref:Carboxypeptidase regulatory-like domain-containing protein n=1 Tax=Sphingorhabdus lutea TaxID=1913578 RepID=A0A1L3J9D7_9SPHN|nr:hypothetical protein [Sphingorhabdus lutea]APG61703.1 hypothetical protein LPB140_01345 [Sphingorhabdus lutea]
MKKSFAIITAMTVFWAMAVQPSYAGSKLKNADAQAKNDEIRNTVIDVYPTIPFDEQDAKNKLAAGDVEIRGALYHRLSYNGTDKQGVLPSPEHPVTAVSNTNIVLYPLTKYLEQWYNLDQKFRKPGFMARFDRNKPRKHAAFDDAMMKYAISRKTDEYGRFSFESMLPGKYYLISSTQASGTYEVQVNAGNSTAVDGWGNVVAVSHTRPENRSFNHQIVYEKIIEVKDDKSVVEIDARMKINY